MASKAIDIWYNSISTKEKLQKTIISSAKVTVERAFVILKVRWRGLLTMLVTNRENVSNMIITCFVLHNFCQINREVYLVDDILQEIVNPERSIHRRKNHSNNDVSQDGVKIRTISKTYINEIKIPGRSHLLRCGYRCFWKGLQKNLSNFRHLFLQTCVKGVSHLIKRQIIVSTP